VEWSFAFFKFNPRQPWAIALAHGLFWLLLLSAASTLRPPLPNGDDPGFRWVPFITLLFFQIPSFYLNAYYFIPRFLREHRGQYFLLIILFTLGNVLLQKQLVPVLAEWLGLDVPKIYRATWAPMLLLPTFTFWAASTSYRLLTDYFAQERTRKEAETARLQSELSFLRSQISPHFIFNVLNSIVSLARKKSDKVETVTLQLSELMRYMLYDADEDRVSLAQEVSYLQSYIDLQRLRFGQTVAIRFELGPIDEHLEIEPMLLIPFVENAFKHGVGLVPEPVVEVRLATEAGRLHFSVRNKVAPAGSSKDHASGIGLANVRRRLSLLYPEAHRLQVAPGPPYFDVQLELNSRARVALRPTHLHPTLPHELPSR
jgi:two-component system, LytTR family, sensor kinase